MTEKLRALQALGWSYCVGFSIERGRVYYARCWGQDYYCTAKSAMRVDVVTADGKSEEEALDRLLTVINGRSPRC